VTTKYLAKFQSPNAITRPKIIRPERKVNLICNLSLYIHIPNIKSISQSIAKKSGDNRFISELRNDTICPGDIKMRNNILIRTKFYWSWAGKPMLTMKTGVPVADVFSFLWWCFFCVLCAQCCLWLWIVHS
jgi:hypothetical protein